MFHEWKTYEFHEKPSKIRFAKRTHKKNFTVSRTYNSSNKEWEIQDMGENIVYKPLLNNIDVATLMNEGDIEIDTGSWDRL